MTREQAKTLIKDMRARETAHRVLFGGEVTPMRSGDLLERPQAIETNLTLKRPMLGESHRQAFVTVNAPVDEGVAPLVDALSRIPSLCTLSSCQGSAFVTFRFGRTLQEQAAFFCWFSLQTVGIATLTAEWGGRDSMVFTLSCPPHSITSLCDRVDQGLSKLRILARHADPYGSPRTKSHNFRDSRSHRTAPRSCDEPDNLARQMLHAVL